MFGTSPPNIALHENGQLVPVVAGEQGAEAVARATKLVGVDSPKAAGFLWSDRNRDGTPQAGEIEFFNTPMPSGPKQAAVVGKDFTLLNGISVGSPEGDQVRLVRLRPRGWTKGVPEISTQWEAVPA